MADAGLFIGWGQVVRGREDRALDVFNETIELYGQMQADGRIESFEVCLLQPHGGELGGFELIRGSEEQIDALRSMAVNPLRYLVAPRFIAGTLMMPVLTVFRLLLSTTNWTPARNDQLPKSAGMNLRGTVKSGPPEK